MKHLIVFGFLATSALAFADVGATRGGGDEFIKTPLWSCEGVKSALKVEVSTFGKSAEVTNEKGEKFTVEVGSLAPEVEYQHLELSPNNYDERRLGFTKTYFHFDGSTYDFDLSIYLETASPDFDKPNSRDAVVYKARVASRLEGKQIPLTELRCRYQQGALQSDSVDRVHPRH